VPLSPISRESGPVNPTRHILFGEDDPDEEDFLREIFASLDPGCILTFINNGKKLLATLEKLPVEELPGLIVLDYNMPELNGAEILQELKRNPRYDGIPKIIWSTSGSELYKKLCLESGALEYFIKPSSIKELEKIARHLLTY
jgi:CheY-like chemotaxis protein